MPVRQLSRHQVEARRLDGSVAQRLTGQISTKENESYKRDHFARQKPRVAEALHPDFAQDDEAEHSRFAKTLAREAPLLINPYEVDPEPLFKWIAEPVLKKELIAPRNGSRRVRQAFKAA